MASGAGQDGAQSKTSIAALRPEILEHICNLLHDPDDLASCHMVDERYRNVDALVCYASVCHVKCGGKPLVGWWKSFY
jgi:hypothetical protein